MSRKKERAGLGSWGEGGHPNSSRQCGDLSASPCAGTAAVVGATRVSTTEALWASPHFLALRLNTRAPGRASPGPGPGGQQPHRAAGLRGFRFLTRTWTCCLLLASSPGQRQGAGCTCPLQAPGHQQRHFPHPAPEGPSFSL